MSEAPSFPENPQRKSDEESLENLSREELVERVTALKKENKRLEKEAITDPLTEVYNRRGLTLFAEKFHLHAEREGEPYAAFVVDIDDFKSINDDYGHEAGDTVLKSIATALLGSVRESDIVGRVGGDEFAGYLVNYTEENFSTISKRLEEKMTGFLKKNLPPGVDTAKIGISIGFAVWRGEENFEDLLKKADNNMYEIKKEKK